MKKIMEITRDISHKYFIEEIDRVNLERTIKKEFKKMRCCGNCKHSIGGKWVVMEQVCLECSKLSNWENKGSK